MSRPEGDKTSVTSERFIEALNERIRRALRVGLTGQYLSYRRGRTPLLIAGGRTPSHRRGRTPCNPPCRTVSAREADVERRDVRVAVLRDVQRQLSAALLEDAVGGVPRDPLCSLLRGRRLRDHLRAQPVVEEELRGELARGRRADLEVDMHGTALVPAGVHRGEFRAARRVGGLVAAQELLAARVVHIRVHAER